MLQRAAEYSRRPKLDLCGNSLEDFWQRQAGTAAHYEERVIPFMAGDGLTLNLIKVPNPERCILRPIVLAHLGHSASQPLSIACPNELCR
jgi:hypothetical protein